MLAWEDGYVIGYSSGQGSIISKVADHKNMLLWDATADGGRVLALISRRITRYRRNNQSSLHARGWYTA